MDSWDMMPTEATMTPATPFDRLASRRVGSINMDDLALFRLMCVPQQRQRGEILIHKYRTHIDTGTDMCGYIYRLTYVCVYDGPGPQLCNKNARLSMSKNLTHNKIRKVNKQLNCLVPNKINEC